MVNHTRAPRRPTLLCILDGFGLNPDPTYNAVVRARTPNFDRYFSDYPMTSLQASGRGVGLPQGQMGNSEVGHMTIGCGTIIKQDLVRIDDAIDDGSFYENPALLAAMQAGATNRAPPAPDRPGFRWWCAQPHRSPRRADSPVSQSPGSAPAAHDYRWS